LINIVEEMAIASGVSAPRLYLLPDEGINAFAAGFHSKDAVIGVTQGAISLLTREEMQGVIAHEFRNIYNGDMRLSMQMLAVYGELITLGLLGGLLIGSKMGVIVVLMGVVLTIAGFTGSFFVRLIEAAVNRQREFLADATAVQYTRDPQSLAGALKKIGGYAGSAICAKKARKYKHLYFATGVSTAMKGWFASHPDLSERIQRIDPQWDGVYPEEL
jgi:Zn-dependent protease with chaperone function